MLCILVHIYICTPLQDEKGLFNFHLSNLEFACGAHLSQVSGIKILTYPI